MNIEIDIKKKHLSYLTDPKSIEEDRQLYFYIKKYILSKPILEVLININDEYVLDGLIEGNYELLDWNAFLKAVALEYHMDELRNDILQRLKSRAKKRMPTYSEIFAMREYYNQVYAKTIRYKYLPKQLDYVYSNLFVFYCVGFSINSYEDFQTVLDDYLEIPYTELVSMMQKYKIERSGALAIILRLANKITRNTIYEYKEKYIIDDDEKGNWILVRVY